MELIPCNNCNHHEFSPLFRKKSSQGEEFTVVKCKSCGLVQVNPQPSEEEVAKYYSNEYFTKRTDRGYDNYYSEKIKNEISRVFNLNLKDLKFFEWEESLAIKTSLDIGCAAGYFVDFMKDRGWKAKGIDIAEAPVAFAREKLGLEVYRADFLDWDLQTEEKFDLITLWASIEHLHKPKETLQKIYRHLKPGGRMILSTCRYGFLAFFQGVNWRFMNVPEHLYYYSLEGLISQCRTIGFKKNAWISYGSGLTTNKEAGLLYQFFKTVADNLVKVTGQGDMIAVSFLKDE